MTQPNSETASPAPQVAAVGLHAVVGWWHSLAADPPPNDVRLLIWCRVHMDDPTFHVGQRLLMGTGDGVTQEWVWVIDAFTYTPTDAHMVAWDAKWAEVNPPNASHEPRTPAPGGSD